ncbi:MAG: hypothetical protein V4736_04175 [Bdellovibrionota bacterium]
MNSIISVLSKFRIVAILTFGVLISTAFQNCSKISVAYTPPVTSNSITGGTETLAEFKPSMAIRAMGCISCHAQVDSNVITDFGYGDFYYFGAGSSNSNYTSGNAYGDHDNSLRKFSLASDKTMYVPKGRVPSNVASATGTSTILNYMSNQFRNSSYTNTKSATVKDLDRIYIGAPTEAQLSSAFSLAPGQRMLYRPSAAATGSLSGLQDAGNFYRNSGTLTCDGDLIVRGPLHLDNLSISTNQGCRIYVIGSVFMFGPVNYVNSSAKRNLQITSTKAISMGLGLAKKNGTACEPGSRWEVEANTTDYGQGSSLLTRYRDLWTIPGNFTRSAGSGADFGRDVIAEAQTIEAVMGPMYDASCRAETRRSIRSYANSPQRWFRAVIIECSCHSRPLHGNDEGNFDRRVCFNQLG